MAAAGCDYSLASRTFFLLFYSMLEFTKTSFWSSPRGRTHTDTLHRNVGLTFEKREPRLDTVGVGFCNGLYGKVRRF